MFFTADKCCCALFLVLQLTMLRHNYLKKQGFKINGTDF